MCLLDLDKYENMIDLFIPSVHDAGHIMTQHDALIFIASLTKFKTISYAMEILSDYFIPHVGETNFIQKAYYLGYIIFRLLSVYNGIEPATDRDNYKYKRIELVGSLIYDLFREYYTIQQREIHLNFEKKLYYNKSLYGNNLPGLIDQNFQTIFKERHVELGFRKAFKGNWGSQVHTRRVGVVQDINRLSFNTMISHLRKTNLPLDSSAKLVGPRVLHGSQWGFIDPIDTPDGANIGLHKTLAITTTVSRGYSREPMIQWLREKLAMKLVEECGPLLLSTMTKVIVNGLWAGSIHNPIEAIHTILLYRRNALIPIYTSATFETKLNTIFIYTDSGRVCRPIFYRVPETTHFSIQNKEIVKRIQEGEFTWSDLVTGFNRKNV
jgi:DNA-directed RNA polymerase II subunit RPB2